MIDNVYGGGEFLVVSQSNGYMPYTNPTQPMNGMVRCNNNRLEVYDGTIWHPIGAGTVHVNLTDEAKNILEWARTKMKEEMQAAVLAKDNEDINKAVKIVNLAHEHLRDLVKDVLDKQRVVEILSEE